MADDWPKIHSRRTSKVSPWIDIIARDVEFAPGTEPQTYHAVSQPDYVAILAVTPAKLIPVVRQFRPAVEQFTWELPAGLVDANEDPAAACRRELLEETGLPALEIHPLGVAAPCTGRLSNRMYSFFVRAGNASPDRRPEKGIEVRLITPAELAQLIKTGEFPSLLHIATLFLAERHSFIDLRSD